VDPKRSVPAPQWLALDGLHDVFDFTWLKDATVAARLDQWRQADLVPGVRLFWASGDGVDQLSGLDMAPPADGGWAVARWEQPLPEDGGPGQVPVPMGIITSQTCDVVATGPGSRHPTVQVSPVIRLDQLAPGRANEVRAGRTVDMVLIANTPEGTEWAADLRISLPVSKSILAAHSPVRAFVTSREAYDFAQRVAIKMRRPAVHEAAISLAKNLDRLVRQQRSAGATWVDRVEQVRARAKSGTLLQLDALELIVMTLDGAFTAEEMAPLRQWRQEQQKQFKTETNGAILIPLRFVELDRMKVQDYRESVPLNLPELGQRPFW
jgi:hypothetical protein